MDSTKTSSIPFPHTIPEKAPVILVGTFSASKKTALLGGDFL
jgi:hypothetical protein